MAWLSRTANTRTTLRRSCRRVDTFDLTRSKLMLWIMKSEFYEHLITAHCSEEGSKRKFKILGTWLNTPQVSCGSKAPQGLVELEMH